MGESKTAWKIRYMLAERGWSVYKLSQVAHIPYSSLNNIFWRQSEPSVATLEKICAAFEMTVSDFLEIDVPHEVSRAYKVANLPTSDFSNSVTDTTESDAWHNQRFVDFVADPTDEQDMLTEVGKRVRFQREVLGYSRRHLSESIGISAQSIADIEHGRKNMTVRTLIKLCGGLGCSSDYLIYGISRMV